MTIRAILFSVIAALGWSGTAAALPPAYLGQDMIAAMPADERAALDAAAQAAPYAQGNLWHARRGDRSVVMLGTYHLDDARHDATMTAIQPHLEQASRLLVEAGPEQEAQLMEMVGRDTSLILLPDGQSLVELLPPDDWTALSAALRARGMPGVMAARLQPWYVSVLLAMPACAMPAAAAGGGLDKRVISAAQALNLPVAPLEPFDTALRIFDTMPDEAQLAMIQTSLALEGRAEDQMATLAAAYFREDSRVIWEFMRKVALELPGADPARVESDLAMMEEAMMNARNRAWLPVIEEAAAKGPVFAAFGALHLSGDEGVLALMEQAGWQITRLPL